MDVFIPEEYVIRRRLEKKEAAIAEKRSKLVLEASQKQDMDRKSVPVLLFGRPDGNGFLREANAMQSANSSVAAACRLISAGSKTRPKSESH
ncbi:hypothetical protein V6N13_046310 [Hibiscus sabdariffa]